MKKWVVRIVVGLLGVFLLIGIIPFSKEIHYSGTDYEFSLAADGAVALVKLATGEEIKVGWCKRMGFEQALRLSSLEYDSGQELDDSPRVKLKLCCRDVTSAFE